jgi:hypothetical protein
LAQWNKTDDVVGYVSSNFVNILHLQYNNMKGFPKSAKNVASITGGVLNQVFLALQGSKDLKHEIRVALVPPRGKNRKTSRDERIWTILKNIFKKRRLNLMT